MFLWQRIHLGLWWKVMHWYELHLVIFDYTFLYLYATVGLQPRMTSLFFIMLLHSDWDGKMYHGILTDPLYQITIRRMAYAYSYFSNRFMLCFELIFYLNYFDKTLWKWGNQKLSEFEDWNLIFLNRWRWMQDGKPRLWRRFGKMCQYIWWISMRL